jgi:hypothetical protein
MSTTPVLPQDDQQLLASLSDLLTGKEENLSSLSSQNQSLSQQLADTRAKLQTLNADDASVGAQLLDLQNRFGVIEKLADIGMGLNLHRLPNTQDPNARPINQWFQPSNSGNTGGASAKPHGPWSITYNDDGSTTYRGNPASTNDNYFWALNLNKSTQRYVRFCQVREVEIPDDQLTPTGMMGYEHNFEQSGFGFRINAGLQALLGTDKDVDTGQLITNKWRWYNIADGHWHDTKLPFDRSMFGTGKIVRLVSIFQPGATPAAGMTHVSLEVNGVPYQINQTSKGLASTWGPYLQAGVQADPIRQEPVQFIMHRDEAYWTF